MTPGGFDCRSQPGLRLELQEKLSSSRPLSLGLASRIPGVTPAAISMLMVYLKRGREREREKTTAD